MRTVDIWINNAALVQTPRARLVDTPPEQIEAVLGTNLRGALFGSRAAIALMQKQDGGGGAVFNVDGTGSRGNATTNSAAYGASKAAIPQLMATLARETAGCQRSSGTGALRKLIN